MSAMRLTWLCTAVTAVLAVVAGAALGAFADALWVAWCLATFALGTIAMLAVLVRAARRSRFDNVDLGAVFLLYGSESKRTVALLHLATLLQIAAPSAAVAMRPYSVAAFGFLVPMVGIAAAGWWAVGALEFPQRVHPGTGQLGSQAK